MILLASRIVLTAIILIVSYFGLVKVWTKNVDLTAALKKPSDVIPVDERAASFSIRSTWTDNPGSERKNWFVKDSVVTPFYAAMLVHFTNLKVVPVMILSYWVEQKMPDGTWKKVGLPFGMDGKFYHGPDLKKVSELTYVTFDFAVQNRNVGPNETVMGWLFFTKPLTSNIRFGFKDTLGNIAIEPLTPIASEGWPTQPVMISVTKSTADISMLPRTN
jgi:hypothetical protein